VFITPREFRSIRIDIHSTIAFLS